MADLDTSAPQEKKALPRTFRGIISVAALSVMVLCATAAWQLLNPQGSFSFYPFSETYFAKGLAARDTANGISWAKKAIRVAPARAENWVLLAYLCQKADHGVTPRVLDALRQSYVVAPLSSDASQERLLVAMQDWPSLPQDLRDEVTAEATTFASTDGGRADIVALIPTMQNHEDRFYFAMIVVKAKADADQRLAAYKAKNGKPLFSK